MDTPSIRGDTCVLAERAQMAAGVARGSTKKRTDLELAFLSAMVWQQERTTGHQFEDSFDPMFLSSTTVIRVSSGCWAGAGLANDCRLGRVCVYVNIVHSPVTLRSKIFWVS